MTLFSETDGAKGLQTCCKGFMCDQFARGIRIAKEYLWLAYQWTVLFGAMLVVEMLREKCICKPPMENNLKFLKISMSQNF